MMMQKGKCFSKIDRGQRDSKDFYQTPYCMTQALMDLDLFSDCTSVLEPACGQGAIINVVYKYFDIVHYYDLHMGNKTDFFNEKCKYDCIITNPPFKIANEFIMKAQTVATKKIAMLLPLNYLQGQKRHDIIFSDSTSPFGLKYVHIFTRMPMLSQEVREDGKYKTGMQAYAWFIWYVDYTGPPQIGWIDSKEHIAHARENKKV